MKRRSFLIALGAAAVMPAFAQAKPMKIGVIGSGRIGSTIGALWAKAGHEVTDFGDGSDAWECLQGFTFDLLLTDIVMPGMDGIELAKRAAEKNGALKIMFITGFAAVALHPASGAPKQAKVLSKPFHLREIVVEVDRMLAAA